MKNIPILAALSAVILTGCGNISPPFKAEQTTVTTAAPTVSAAASSEAESTVDEEQVKHDTFIAEFFDSNICFVDTSTLVTEAMKGCSFDNETDNSNGVQKITLKGTNGGGTIDVMCVDLSQAQLDHDMEYILENFGDYYFGQTSAQMSGITEDDFVSNYRMTSSVVSKGKYQRYVSVQKSDGMATQFGYAETYAVLNENKLTVVSGGISQLGYDGKAEFFAADESVCGKCKVLI
ncbi:hypothetical protein ABHC51_13440 [Ruminococcus bicirculans (ex Wegman et al. 2014)]|uniref:hypothetical protein n=1 Tax=Ruminococcus bicirculans (ex Wegman et al. 2014) TaxID=1160721 RepID=UPI00325BC220